MQIALMVIGYALVYISGLLAGVRIAEKAYKGETK